MTDDRFPLTVTIPAEEWSHAQRRLQYLEAVTIQLLRGRSRVREHYTIAEITEMRLRGLPRSRSGLARLAKAEGWRYRIGVGKGGERYEYHISSFPSQAFDDLLGNILGMEDVWEEPPDTIPALPIKPPLSPSIRDSNATPPWVLPLLRIIRRDGTPTPEEVWRRIPDDPTCIHPLPTLSQVREVMQNLGYL